MKVTRDYDCSIVFGFTDAECRDMDSEISLEADVDQLRWNELAGHFISLAQRYDPEGDFIVIEDFDPDGFTVGYTAFRKEPLMGKREDIGESPFPTFGPDFEECEFPALTTRNDQRDAATNYSTVAQKHNFTAVF